MYKFEFNNGFYIEEDWDIYNYKEKFVTWWDRFKEHDISGYEYILCGGFLNKESCKDIDIVILKGAIEIAPILGLSDCIVDLVQTGKTLKENGLKELDLISDISSRLIVNKSSFKTNNKTIKNSDCY